MLRIVQGTPAELEQTANGLMAQGYTPLGGLAPVGDGKFALGLVDTLAMNLALAGAREANTRAQAAAEKAKKTPPVDTTPAADAGDAIAQP